MADRIEIGFKKGIRDALGEKIKRRIGANFSLPVEQVHSVEVYTIEGGLTKNELKQAAAGPLSDPVIQHFAVNKPIARDFDWLIEVGFRPGVTDNVGKTAREAIELLLAEKTGARKISVYTSRQYLIKGKISRTDAQRIASGLLANDLIERHQIVAGSDFDFVRGLPACAPHVAGEEKPAVEKMDLVRFDDFQLKRISQEKLLALNLEEMKVLQEYFQKKNIIAQRNKVGLTEKITDVELECLAQTWSEHCKHKIFNAAIVYTDSRGRQTIDSLFKTYIKGSTARIRKAKGKKDFCLSVFVDNAGVI